MNLSKFTTTEIKALLSSLWIFVLLNILFRDIHEFARVGMIEELMNAQVAESTLLIAGIVLQIPLLMVVLSRLLPSHIGRWVNPIAAGIMILGTVGSGVNDLDDTLFLVVELMALLSITWVAYRHLVSQPMTNHTRTIQEQSA